MIKYLLQKEFKQLLRHSFIPKIIVVLPLMAILVFPWAANQEITNINMAIVDRDHSTYTARLTGQISASDYFQLQAVVSTYEEAIQLVEQGKVDIVLDLPPQLEKDMVTQGTAKIMIAANAVNIMKGGLGYNYLINIFQSSLANRFSNPIPIETISIDTQTRFNPYMDYKRYMIPALMVMLMTIICGFLPTLNIVSEKETGTIEQINVTPVSKGAFILAKLIPYWTIGLFVLTVCLSLAALVYGLLPRGNILTVYFFAFIYILVVSGIGLVISNYSNTMQQAMFVMFFFLIIMLLMSGLFTPIASMPEWAQTVTLFNPLRYFIEVMRMVYLKGSPLAYLLPQLRALTLFAVILNSWAVISYSKKG
jgi:ABC-2 type transport system permease protein